ncbi:MAG: GNAT family N-acetyltransferase [Jatrophihabitans sp.]
MSIRTERLILRRWTPSDRTPFAAMNADPQVMRYFRAPLDRAASDGFVDRIEAGFDQHGYGLWALELVANAEFIGFTGLARHTFPAHFTPAVEVGWRLSPPAWGHGFATEAARAALRHGFDSAGLAEIVSMTARANQPSQAVMRRLGMTRDPADDFAHPSLPAEHPLAPHVLYRLSQDRYRSNRAEAGSDADAEAGLVPERLRS